MLYQMIYSEMNDNIFCGESVHMQLCPIFITYYLDIILALA
jgi:hypothetical protein